MKGEVLFSWATFLEPKSLTIFVLGLYIKQSFFAFQYLPTKYCTGNIYTSKFEVSVNNDRTSIMVAPTVD